MMTNSEIVVAVDLGASSGRVIAAELLPNRIQLSDVHRFENAPVPMGSRLHWNIHGLWQQIEKGLGLAASEYGDRIESVGVDTWGVDYVLLDRNLDMVGPAFCYRDARTQGMMKRAFERISQSDIFAESGIQFMEINTLYQLFSMHVQESPLLDIAEHFLMIPDFINWLLAGVLTNEYTNASTTQMLHPTSGTWSPRILDALQTPKVLQATPGKYDSEVRGFLMRPELLHRRLTVRVGLFAERNRTSLEACRKEQGTCGGLGRTKFAKVWHCQPSSPVVANRT